MGVKIQDLAPSPTLVTIVSVILTFYSAYRGPLSKFPGPKLHALRRDHIEIPELHRQYGEVVRIGPNELSVQGSAQVWKDVHGFRKAGEVRPYKDEDFYGQPVNKRKIVSSSFSDKALKEQEPLVRYWAGKLKDSLTDHAGADEPTDMVKMLNCTTFDVMADLIFAEPLHMLENSEYVPWVKTIIASIQIATIIRGVSMLCKPNKRLMEYIFMRTPAIKRKTMEHWEFTTERVDRRLNKTPDRPDLCGTLYYLLTNPRYLQTLQEQLRSKSPQVRSLTFEGLQRYRYLNAVLNEGLRMYPPVPIGLQRVSPSGGVTIAGHFVPENTKFMVHNLATNRAESNFKRAYEFRPERWMGDEEYEDDHLDALEPFSVGPRNCLGKNLAWHEMRLLLATILIHFDFRLCEESKDWSDQKVYTLWQKHPLMCTIEVAQP
ncbi:cytochrome P450 [Polychaeton citri CBS 116435]|uniref:Cytochrome P450 n=1 Tax=Polychaeton citri CBS 116435 TaxID=1314669 RepID=A0A9P4Q3N3_9PEZI|nr:cytochrome P450 [Polychaeton citri CBS 116435]